MLKVNRDMNNMVCDKESENDCVRKYLIKLIHLTKYRYLCHKSINLKDSVT